MIVRVINEVIKMKKMVHKIGLILAVLHSIGVIVTIVYINLSTSPQAPLLWGLFAVLDFPISLLYYFTGGLYAKIFHMAGESFLAQMLYPPHVIHGLLGGIWWYFLPRFFTTKRFGGVWGKKNIGDVC
jgi:hypothetical protein